MFIIRRPKLDDLGTLLKLAKMVHFINLPADREILATKIMLARTSFAKAAGASVPPETGPSSAGELNGTPRKSARPRSKSAETGAGEPAVAAVPQSLKNAGRMWDQHEQFMFVLEDTEIQAVLGTSQIIARMGGKDHPNLSFKLSHKEFFSESLQYGTKHTVAKLHLDFSGPTEMGGLILQPSYRNHKERLGRFLSLVRFHFIALHREFFSDRLIAEMMAPISADGHNPLWEYLGRRFINLTYDEADRFCQYSREFMYNLLPRDEIYLSLLPAEARNVVGQVGPETVPARRMLEKLGFKYEDTIDPFDGGPHLEAKTGQIEIVKRTFVGEAGSPLTGAGKQRGMVSRLGDDGEFVAVVSEYTKSDGAVRLPRATLEALHAEPGVEVGVTPAEVYEGGRSASNELKPRKRAKKDAAV